MRPAQQSPTECNACGPASSWTDEMDQLALCSGVSKLFCYEWPPLYMQILFIILSMSLMDVVGQRPLLLNSSVGCAVSLLALSILFQNPNPPLNFAASILVFFLHWFWPDHQCDCF